MVFGAIDYLFMGLYLMAVVLVGLYCGRGQHNIKDFLQGGRKLMVIPLAISLQASLFSSIGFLAGPAEAFRNDFQYLPFIVIAFPAAFIAGYLFVEFYYRLKVFTVFEYIERRFGRSMHALTVFLFLTKRGLYAGMVVYALSLAVHVATGFPLAGVILIAGISAILYTAVGGLKAVVWTDVMQFCVLSGSIVMILWYLVNGIEGGIPEIIRVGMEHNKFKLANFEFSLTTRMTLWGLLAGTMTNFMAEKGVDQVNAQIYMSARSAKAARHSMWLAPVFTVWLFPALYFIGAGFFVYYLKYPNDQVASFVAEGKHDKILPFFVVNMIPAGVRGIIIAGLAAAAMSTLDSVLNALSSITLIDIYKSRLRPSQSDKHYLNMSRLFVVFWGALITVSALYIMPNFGSILEGTFKILGWIGGILLGIFLLGMLSKRANLAGVYIGAVCGVGVVVYLAYFSNIAFIWSALSSMVATVIPGYFASLFFPSPQAEQLEGLMWQDVVLKAIRRERKQSDQS